MPLTIIQTSILAFIIQHSNDFFFLTLCTLQPQWERYCILPIFLILKTQHTVYNYSSVFIFFHLHITRRLYFNNNGLLVACECGIQRHMVQMVYRCLNISMRLGDWDLRQLCLLGCLSNPKPPCPFIPGDEGDRFLSVGAMIWNSLGNTAIEHTRVFLFRGQFWNLEKNKLYILMCPSFPTMGITCCVYCSCSLTG